MRIIVEAFILDERYRNFVCGQAKSQKLYHSHENNEPSLLLGMSIFIFSMLLSLLPFIVIIFALGSFFSFQAFGIETEVIVTDLNHQKLAYIYEVNGQAFRGIERLGNYVDSGYSVGQSFRIFYLVYFPEQSMRSSSIWGSLLILLLITPIMLLSAAVPFYFSTIELNKSMATYKKFQRLQNAIVLNGEVTNASLNLYDRIYGYPILTVQYGFLSPDGKALTGIRRHIRRDLTVDRVPDEGTPVNILYADDDCHMLL